MIPDKFIGVFRSESGGPAWGVSLRANGNLLMSRESPFLPGTLESLVYEPPKPEKEKTSPFGEWLTRNYRDYQKEDRETVLEEAARLTSKDRRAEYSPPSDDFGKTARIWSGILMPKLKDGEWISTREVALMMAGMKMSREVFKHKRDSVVDAIGYLSVIPELEGDV